MEKYIAQLGFTCFPSPVSWKHYVLYLLGSLDYPDTKLVYNTSVTATYTEHVDFVEYHSSNNVRTIEVFIRFTTNFRKNQRYCYKMSLFKE